METSSHLRSGFASVGCQFLFLFRIENKLAGKKFLHKVIIASFIIGVCLVITSRIENNKRPVHYC